MLGALRAGVESGCTEALEGAGPWGTATWRLQAWLSPAGGAAGSLMAGPGVGVGLAGPAGKGAWPVKEGAWLRPAARG